jgi:hypothetical protein
MNILKMEDVIKLVHKFMSKKPLHFRRDTDVFGELVTCALMALNNFKAEKGFKPSTLIFAYLSRGFCDIVNREKRFYRRHKFGCDMVLMKSKEQNPLNESLTEEVKKIVLSSELSKRCKEVILEKIRHPNMTLEQLGHILGVTKQCVSFHLISAEQYFKSQDIFIDV